VYEVHNEILHKAESFVKEALGADTTGHDWYHIARVRKNALHIWEKEQCGDRFIIEMAALLHDIADGKLNSSEEAGYERLRTFLDGLPIYVEQKDQIIQIISSISYKGGQKKHLPSIEAKIVQDADRLDAIGAIGIARAFAYGGSKGQPIYDPNLSQREEMTIEEYRSGKSSSIHHFYEKLLKLKDLLHTESAKNMAHERHEFMKVFLHQFYSEWNGSS
jgi:uncharacterized protein